TLALGIGATATMFSVVDGVLLKRLPYRDSDRLLALAAAPARSAAPIAVSPGDYLEWEAQNRTFDGMAAFTLSPYTLTGGGVPLRVSAGVMSPGFAELLGVAPMVGRTLADAGDARAAVISARLWRTQFQSDPAIAGRSIAIDGQAYTIAGVMPDGFSFP